jgi:hypothetical protein
VAKKGRGGRGGGGGKGTPTVGAPPVATPPPTTEATMAPKIEQLSRGLPPWQVSSINHIQEAKLPHLMGEMISLIWLV